jgi:alkanesulfonate monooxygenase SsuD/methylene tetrahydromethanopterin reductase-like flavin-dependent oxidoreductase (luciferase family)
MFLSYFTEQPYSALSHEKSNQLYPFDHPSRRSGDNVLLHSNRFFDPVEGARLYKERLREYELADEVGFDGIMLNEHHNSAFCMQPRLSIMASMLAVSTKRAKIVQLGNPLPVWDNPVQLAEDTSMIDMISGGRLVAGVVRGGGVEQLSNNANPAYNRDRFAEAHDLLIKAWTQPGPFSWHGEHYQVRVVNPWATPLQKPHPRVWIPGIISKETIDFAAAHAYPYICLNTTVEDTLRIWDYYDAQAAKAGFQGGPEYRGYLMRVHVAETEEVAIRNAREFLWLAGSFAGYGSPTWISPTGYTSWEARAARSAHNKVLSDFDAQLKMGTIIAGTPSQVIERIQWWLEKTRPGMLMLWCNDGHVDHANSMNCIRLMGEKVLPAVKKFGNDLGLKDPFSANAPVSLAHMRELQKKVA